MALPGDNKIRNVYNIYIYTSSLHMVAVALCCYALRLYRYRDFLFIKASCCNLYIILYKYTYKGGRNQYRLLLYPRLLKTRKDFRIKSRSAPVCKELYWDITILNNFYQKFDGHMCSAMSPPLSWVDKNSDTSDTWQ